VIYHYSACRLHVIFVTSPGRVFDAGMKLLLLLLLTVYAGQVRASVDRCPSELPSTTAVKVFRDICYQFVSEERYWTSARDYCIQVC